MVDYLGFMIGAPVDGGGGGDDCPPCPPCDDDTDGAQFGAAVVEGINGPATAAPDTRVIKLRVWEDSTPTLLRRVTDVEGGYLDTNAVVQIGLKVFDLSGATPDVPVVNTNVGVQECLFNSLQLDGAWDEDALGYNFRHKLWQSILTNGGHVYRVEYTIEKLSLDVYVPTREITLAWELHTIARMGR